MTNKFLAASVAAGLLACAPAVTAQAPRKGSGPVEIEGPVRVIDGDTFELYVNGRQMGFGLVGITVPPANTRCGRLAAQFTQDLVNGSLESRKKVKLRFEEDDEQEFDRRQRRVYYLKLPGGVSAAVELVRAGLAVPDGTGQERNELQRVARQAVKCVD